MINIKIQREKAENIDGILSLLGQVLAVHHEGRPDLFRKNGSKYSRSELEKMVLDDENPFFVALDDAGNVVGYAFCNIHRYKNHGAFNDFDSLYIDDICVDEQARGNKVGTRIFEFVKNFANREGFYNITLNVWAENPTAMRFYEACGMKEQKRGMEFILG